MPPAARYDTLVRTLSERYAELPPRLQGIARYAAELDRLGKHTTGKGCLYIKRLADVDPKVLEAVVRKAVKP